jgi:hypothetical protein
MGVGVGVGVGVSLGVGVGVGDDVSAGVAVGVAVPVALGVGLPVPRGWVVASAARTTVPNPAPVAGVVTGSRVADGLGLISGAAGVSTAATGGTWGEARWRALKYTIVNRTTSTINARLAATSVGANIDLLESHRPFQRMASLPPCEPALVRPF